MPCNREPGDLFERPVLNKMLLQLLVKAILITAGLQPSRQVGVPPIFQYIQSCF